MPEEISHTSRRCNGVLSCLRTTQEAQCSFVMVQSMHLYVPGSLRQLAHAGGDGCSRRPSRRISSSTITGRCKRNVSIFVYKGD